MFKKCEICGKTFNKPYNCSVKSWEFVRFCSRKCRCLWMKKFSGSSNPNWKGGKVLCNGYFYIKVDGKRIAEHRAIIEKSINRKLKRSEIVHHIDGNKLNNNIENLFIFNSNSEHLKKHYQKQSLIGININRTKLLTNEEITTRNRIYSRKWRKINIEKYRKYQREYQYNMRHNKIIKKA